MMPYTSGNEGQLEAEGSSESPLFLAKVFQLAQNLSHCPLLRLSCTSRPTCSMCCLARGRASVKKQPIQDAGGTSLRARWVKQEAARAPRQPTGLWWVTLPVSRVSPTSFGTSERQNSPIQAARMAAPQPPPLSSEQGILFQLEASSSIMLSVFMQVLPGARPAMHFEHFLYSLATRLATTSTLSVQVLWTRPWAVARCMTVSSEQRQSRLRLRARGPLPWVRAIISLWTRVLLKLNSQVPFLQPMASPAAASSMHASNRSLPGYFLGLTSPSASILLQLFVNSQPYLCLIPIWEAAKTFYPRCFTVHSWCDFTAQRREEHTR